jgi:hypothetical protein
MPKKIVVRTTKLRIPTAKTKSGVSSKLKKWNAHAGARVAQARASERLTHRDFAIRINAR